MKTMQQIEFEAIDEAIRVHGGCRRAAAKALDIGERSLYRKISSPEFKAHMAAGAERTRSIREEIDELKARVAKLENQQ